MLKIFRKSLNKKGFTLVELIIVIAILGILAAIAIPKFDNILARSRTNADAVTLDTVAKAAALWYVNENQTGNAVPDINDDLKDGGYIEDVPTNSDQIVRPSTSANADITLTNNGNGDFTAAWD